MVHCLCCGMSNHLFAGVTEEKMKFNLFRWVTKYPCGKRQKVMYQMCPLLNKYLQAKFCSLES